MNIISKKVLTVLLLACVACALFSVGVTAEETAAINVPETNISDATAAPFEEDAGRIDDTTVTSPLLDAADSLLDNAVSVVDDASEKVSDMQNVTEGYVSSADTTDSAVSSSSRMAALIVCILVAISILLLIVILIPKRKR